MLDEITLMEAPKEQYERTDPRQELYQFCTIGDVMSC